MTLYNVFHKIDTPYLYPSSLVSKYYSCGVKWVGSGENPTLHMAYVFFIYMFGFILPVAIIFTSYLKIIKTIKLKVS